MILEVEKLSISFAEKVVKDVSFTVPKGKIVAMVGSSGSGKTVTGLSVMGLLPFYNGKVDSGSILFHDNDKTIDITKQNQKQLESIRGSKIAMIFQNPSASLDPIMKIGKQLAEVVNKQHINLTKRETEEIVFDTLKSVGLTDVERVVNSYPFTLSGGMCQRVMIAMAILSNASLMIADEPTTFLDVDTEKQILDLLKRINQEKNTSILFITHNLAIASKFAETILVMHNGEIVESGETVSIFAKPKHPYTKKLLQAIY